ncbi:hypothetical protein [Nocardia sp. NBC_01009]|uniref:hypothetical protein n=1 Tax=Nocardia sp. NBC_01009 TaxID=2975996 RepID=UPI0038638015|nr:hypothetical protein OHA42_25030 [Nocardia sp. NBC_01009]
MVWLLPLGDEQHPKERDSITVSGIQFRLEHEPPTVPFTVSEAHDAAQEHSECRIDECGRKRSAFLVLVLAGAVMPDRRLERVLNDD